MTTLTAGSKRSVTVRAVITRADGRVEDLGVVSYWHRSWWRRAVWRLGRIVRG